MISFKAYYNNSVNQVLYENLYYVPSEKSFEYDKYNEHGVKEKRRYEGGIDLLKPILKYTTLQGTNTEYLSNKVSHSHDDHGVFYGYDIISNKRSKTDLKGLEDPEKFKNKIFAALKGHANDTANVPYKDKDWATLEGKPVEGRFEVKPTEYELIINTAVNKFGETVSKNNIKYNLIVYPESRSVHAKDLSERIFNTLQIKNTTPEGSIKAPVPLSKLQTKEQDDTLSSRLFDLEKIGVAFANAIHEAFKNAEIGEYITVEVKNNITKQAEVAAGVIINKLLRGTNTISTASNLRPTPGDVFFTDILRELNKQPESPYREIYDIALNDLIKKEKVKIFKSVSRIYNFQKASHYNVNSIVDLIKNAAINNSVRILLVDDNINTGDTFKQMGFMVEELSNFKELTGIKINWDYFILIKDELYAANPQSVDFEKIKQRREEEESAKKRQNAIDARTAWKQIQSRNLAADQSDYTWNPNTKQWIKK